MAYGLTGFPDVEGIETVIFGGVFDLAGLTGFPDVEGIETQTRFPFSISLESDRLP